MSRVPDSNQHSEQEGALRLAREIVDISYGPSADARTLARALLSLEEDLRWWKTHGESFERDNVTLASDRDLARAEVGRLEEQYEVVRQRIIELERNLQYEEYVSSEREQLVEQLEALREDRDHWKWDNDEATKEIVARAERAEEQLEASQETLAKIRDAAERQVEGEYQPGWLSCSWVIDVIDDPNPASKPPAPPADPSNRFDRKGRFIDASDPASEPDMSEQERDEEIWPRHGARPV